MLIPSYFRRSIRCKTASALIFPVSLTDLRVLLNISTNFVLSHALNAYARLGDHAAATRMADAIVRLYPTVRDYRYWRGQTYEKSKNYKAALADYISSVDLAADLSKIGASDFYNVSRMYEVLGRPCD